ncbi:hypothetical protein Zm00014a_020802 [Zea mays]|uniref:Uncharacterized protein n=1 Tax=Zea mays TaxID=4577 RepID=A0A3L6FCK2_MAIZE|nr:hypothetical protein Zm00014a_020802 [Zea mays]
MALLVTESLNFPKRLTQRWFRKKPFPLFYSLEALYEEMTSEAQSVSAIHEAREGEGSKSRKRKQSHVGAALEDYVEFKKSQTNKALDALKNFP